MADVPILDSDLEDMCKHGTDYMCVEHKTICEKFLQDGEITDEILKVYCVGEIESWGDMCDGKDIVFKYGEKTIIGYWDDDAEYPAVIKSIT